VNLALIIVDIKIAVLRDRLSVTQGSKELRLKKRSAMVMVTHYDVTSNQDVVDLNSGNISRNWHPHQVALRLILLPKQTLS
jgi:hypothetical protein